MCRGDQVLFAERTTDADCDRFLSYAGVQETSKVAGTEALLDLLLEPTDHEHLAQELAQSLARKRRRVPPLHGAAFPTVTATVAASSVCRFACSPPSSSEKESVNFSIASVSSVSTTSS